MFEFLSPESVNISVYMANGTLADVIKLRILRCEGYDYPGGFDVIPRVLESEQRGKRVRVRKEKL